MIVTSIFVLNGNTSHGECDQEEGKSLWFIAQSSDKGCMGEGSPSTVKISKLIFKMVQSNGF